MSWYRITGRNYKMRRVRIFPKKRRGLLCDISTSLFQMVEDFADEDFEDDEDDDPWEKEIRRHGLKTITINSMSPWEARRIDAWIAGRIRRQRAYILTEGLCLFETPFSDLHRTGVNGVRFDTINFPEGDYLNNEVSIWMAEKQLTAFETFLASLPPRKYIPMVGPFTEKALRELKQNIEKYAARVNHWLIGSNDDDFPFPTRIKSTPLVLTMADDPRHGAMMIKLSRD